MPNPDEVATMVVDNHQFSDFESVWVQHGWTMTYPEFRFTTADITDVPGAAPPANWQKLQFKPRDRCTIQLGGSDALEGVILTRQTAYDANNKA